MKSMLQMLAALMLVMYASEALAGETRRAVPGARAPAASVADLAWLAGQWEGDGIGGAAATEVYSAPAGSQIVGHFRQLRADGSVMFYEIMTIVETSGTLHYRLKHFNADLTGWEERERVITFPLVAVERDAWFFDGLTIRKDGSNGMIAAVRIRGENDEPRELMFRYKRAGS